MKAVLLIVSVICIFCFFGCASTPKPWETWRSQQEAELYSKSSLAETSAGTIEYFIDGEGFPVLGIHGSMGGYDADRAIGKIFQDGNLQIISFSRPGYLRTPMETGVSTAEQADATAALLDYLNIDSVIVVGGSAGGPPAMQFALRHPERCRGLILASSRFEQRHLEEFTRAERNNLNRSFEDKNSYRNYRTLMKNPALVASMMLPHTAPVLKKDPEKAALAIDIMKTSFPMSIRKEGTINDLSNAATVTADELQAIRVPTLILHGSLDEWAPLETAKEAAALIPDCRIEVFEGDHFFFITFLEEVRPLVTEFISAHMPR